MAPRQPLCRPIRGLPIVGRRDKFYTTKSHGKTPPEMAEVRSQVAGDLGLDSKCPKLIRNPIKAGREHPEPTAQQNHAGFRRKSTRTPQQYGSG